MFPVLFTDSPTTPLFTHVLHYATAANAFAMVAILLITRSHYSIDVVVAYFVTTTTW